MKASNKGKQREEAVVGQLLPILPCQRTQAHASFGCPELDVGRSTFTPFPPSLSFRVEAAVLFIPNFHVGCSMFEVHSLVLNPLDP